MNSAAARTSSSMIRRASGSRRPCAAEDHSGQLDDQVGGIKACRFQVNRRRPPADHRYPTGSLIRAPTVTGSVHLGPSMANLRDVHSASRRAAFREINWFGPGAG